METRFKCLQKEWTSIGAVAEGAEDLLGYENGACVIKVGIFAELLAKEIMRIEKLKDRSDKKQTERLDILKDKGILPEEIDSALRNIEMQRNKSANGEIKATEEEAEAVIDLAKEAAEWFDGKYSTDEKKNESEFIEPKEVAWKEEKKEKKPLMKERKITKFFRGLFILIIILLILALSALEFYLIKGL